MKHLNLQKLQTSLRNKFLKSGVKMIGPDTIYFSKDTKIGKWRMQTDRICGHLQA